MQHGRPFHSPRDNPHMSVTHPGRSFNSGEAQVRPALVAVAIFLVTVAVALLFSGLPH